MLELGKVALRAPVRTLVFGWLICLFFFMLVALLVAGEYARKEEVQGRVLTRDVVRIASEGNAHVQEVLVVAGQSVRKDQPLLRIRPQEPENFSDGSGQTTATQSAERLDSLLADTHSDEAQAHDVYRTQRESLSLQIDQLQADLDLNARIEQSIQRRVAIAAGLQQRHERLAREGAVSEAALNEAIVRHETAQQNLASNQQGRAAARQRLLELQQRGSDAEHQLTLRLSDIARQRHELLERRETLRKHQQYVLLSPVDGVVDGVSVFAGGRAQAGQPMLLLRIDQPERAMPTVMLDVSPSSIGFASPGTPVIVRIDAYPYERYGVVKGRIVRSTASTYRDVPLGASADTPTEGAVYLVEVALDFSDPRTRIREHWLKDGMTLRGSLRLESLSLMEWLFLPVLKGSQRNPDYLPALMPNAAGQAT
ncbi:HlyD family efflux transporter periplasmic adaptor subunit [Pseudomonas sp. MWU16-30317]|uniref:HlyD family secretion protein n=1 Tax=Pseudomonas sp. MWU16-30317 TaxID=2878095 RepID=UPI001CF98770|nr:HlyD family efflux transporter periplasmic adaptor subunit [Pseudomonas sp. MWU16-30317]